MGRIDTWGDWLRLPVTFLGGLITLRNVFVSCYDLSMDSIRSRPLVNATMFRRLNELLRSWRRGLFFLTGALCVVVAASPPGVLCRRLCPLSFHACPMKGNPQPIPTPTPTPTRTKSWCT